MMQALFWATLSPGPPEELDITSDWDTMTTVCFVIYQIAAVIIFLNLLIAVMNTTINKLEDRKVLYWQFTKASMQVSFFGDTAVIPSPWNLLGFDVWPVMVIGSFLGVRQMMAECSIDKSDKSVSGHSAFESNAAAERENYARLLLSLIERHQDNRRQKDLEEEVERNKLRTLKEELIEDIREMMRKERRLLHDEDKTKL
jgi:hypothetical protein